MHLQLLFAAFIIFYSLNYQRVYSELLFSILLMNVIHVNTSQLMFLCNQEADRCCN